MKTAFIAPKVAEDSWYKNNLDEIITKDNIDSFIPKLDTNSARTELENLQNIQAKINETKGSWDDYNNQFLNGRRYLLDYAKSNNVLGATVDNVKQANQAARDSVIAHNKALKEQTLSAKADKIALQGLAMVGNMLAGVLIAKGFELLSKVIDDYVNRIDKAKEASEEFLSSFESSQQTLASHKELIKTVEEEYLGFANGVDSLGRNISLSTEDFQKYQNICNQIAEAYPQMVSAWDKEGNAVINLKNKVNELKEAYFLDAFFYCIYFFYELRFIYENKKWKEDYD